MDTGKCVNIDSVVVEDVVWLRKKCDYNQMNMSELDATMKGIIHVLKW